MAASPTIQAGTDAAARAHGHDAVGAAEAVPFSIVCLSPQRWDADLPTNRQQLMLRAARRGHAVLFVETSTFLGRHLRRLATGPDRAGTLRELIGSREVAPGIRARKALNAIPWGHSRRLPNAVNCFLTGQALRRLVRRLPQPTVLWIYDPCTARLAGACGDDVVVYDCVDDYGEQTADPRTRSFVGRSDLETASRADLVFATARSLFDRHRQANPRTYHVPNVGDFDHFSPAADRAFAAPDVRDLPKPVVGFAGNIMATKVDLDLLEAVAAARPVWTLLLVGPVRPDAQESLERLLELPNVHWTGPKPYQEVPRYVAAFDVGLIPYAANSYTRSCFPLKTYEYLAAGKPVVATGLPELAGMGPDVALVDGVDAFLTAVETALELQEHHDRERRVFRAARNTWDGRVDRLLGLISAQLAR
jgi:glycosyltransferase involved in cell wall biosynthesis